VKIGLLDSGIGLLAAAAAVRRARGDVDLVLSSDPETMPWGPRSADELTRLAMGCARAAAAEGLDALVVACNTASVHALPALRAAFEPGLPVIGTVPAIKPAAAEHATVAIWATPATTGRDTAKSPSWPRPAIVRPPKQAAATLSGWPSISAASRNAASSDMASAPPATRPRARCTPATIAADDEPRPRA